MVMTSWGNDNKVTSFIDHPLETNLEKPFTISAWLTFSAWLTSSDSFDWRTILSFESPLCRTSLLSIALMPGGQVVYFGYMRDAQYRVHKKTEALAPASAWFHFAFVLLDSYGLAIYVNGTKLVFGGIEGPIFNPEPAEHRDLLYSFSLLIFIVQKRVVIGRTKFNGNFTAQWNGKIKNVKVFDRALTDVCFLSGFVEDRLICLFRRERSPWNQSGLIEVIFSR